MKRILVLLFVLLLLFNCVTAYALPSFSYEVIDSSENKLILNEGINISETRGQEYLIKGTKYSLPIKYDANLLNAFSTKNSSEYIWTGNIYIVRSTEMDHVWFPQDYFIKPLQFYDADLELIYEHKFDQHVMEIGYWKGSYYCRLAGRSLGDTAGTRLPEKVVKSTDMKNWKETNEEIPHFIGSIAYTKEGSVALNQENMLPVSYENDKKLKFCSTLGEWIVKQDEEQNFYFSNDNVYYIKVEFPSELIEMTKRYGFSYLFKSVYEYDRKIIIELKINGFHVTNQEDAQFVKNGAWTTKTIRLSVPTEEVYAALDEQKAKAEYITLNGELLGFEEMPVREDDRLLVPMRFLFEKMGAEVEWDQDTQTATVLQENDAVAFQINNRSATVNSQAQTMDVPARLINGKTMIPIRFLSENLGYTVEWDEETNMAIITK